MEGKARPTSLCSGEAFPKGFLSLVTMHGQVNSCVCSRKDVLQQIGQKGERGDGDNFIL